MSGLPIVVIAALMWWAWRARAPRQAGAADLAAIVAGLVGVLLLVRGQEVAAALALGGSGWWLWRRRAGGGGVADVMSREQASRLLDVPIDASPEAIRAAHRRLVSRVHPDAGGSAPLAAQVNAARDALLGHRS